MLTFSDMIYKITDNMRTSSDIIYKITYLGSQNMVLARNALASSPALGNLIGWFIVIALIGVSIPTPFLYGLLDWITLKR